jgi:DNA-binding GntR family transcriptional regulator
MSTPLELQKEEFFMLRLVALTEYFNIERIVSKIHRLEISPFTSVTGLKSVEQHKQMIEACKNKDRETIACLLKGNWLSLGELLTQQTD